MEKVVKHCSKVMPLFNNLNLHRSQFGVQIFHHQKFNHLTLIHDRVRDKTLHHVRVRIRVRVIDSSPLAISCYKVYVIRCLVIECQ